MDFSKISRVVDQLIVNKHNIFHIYSREIMGLINNSQSTIKNVQRRCESSEILIKQGLSPSEALFAMEWTDLKIKWAGNDYICLSSERQFAYLTNMLDDLTNLIDVFIIENNDLVVSSHFASSGLYNLISINMQSEDIDREYYTWELKDCEWKLLSQLDFTTSVQVQSLGDLSFKSCIVAGIELNDEYRVFKSNECWWETVNRVGNDCYYEPHEDHDEDDHDSSYTSSEDEEWIWTDEE